MNQVSLSHCFQCEYFSIFAFDNQTFTFHTLKSKTITLTLFWGFFLITNYQLNI